MPLTACNHCMRQPVLFLLCQGVQLGLALAISARVSLEFGCALHGRFEN